MVRMHSGSEGGLLKVGELAELANLTVRTLHHYDRIGLLRPSARSDAGYRLYHRRDVARLYRIQALRAFGLGLTDIGSALDSPEGDPLALIDRQVALLDGQIAQAQATRAELVRVRNELAAGGDAGMATWLLALGTTTERLSIYERYFSADELQALPLYHDPEVRTRWDALIREACVLIKAAVPPGSADARAFAARWLHAFERDTGGDPALMSRLNTAAVHEQERIGLPAPLMHYVFAAISELKAELWSRHLRPEIAARMQAHLAARGHQWLPLIARVHAQQAADPDGATPASRKLGKAWMALFHDMVGADPADVIAYRHALAQEPLLSMGTGVGAADMAWLRRTVQAKQGGAAITHPYD